MLIRLHQGQPVLVAGEPLERAKAAMIMVHGRGAMAEDILSLADEFDIPGFAYLAPQAANNTWYPYRFLEPIEQNEPWLSSALRVIEDLCARVIHTGIAEERLILLGFSQGACLTLEYVARHAHRYGGVAGLSGGLIGPAGTPRNYAGTLNSTPILLGCSDIDIHIPLARVRETAEVLRKLGGEVTERIYPNMDHTIVQDEIDFVREMMNSVTSEG